MAQVEELVRQSADKALVKKSLEGSIGTITLDNPAKHNALSAALIEDLLAALSDLRSSGVRAIVLRAQKGANVWSAGHDVRELPTNGRDPLTYDDPLRRVVREIKESPTPIIAMVEGGVWGGACEVVMSCDIVIAAEGTTFAITPAKLGVPYDIEGTLSFMQSVSLPVIKEMLFTAQPMTADCAASGTHQSGCPPGTPGVGDHGTGRAHDPKFATGDLAIERAAACPRRSASA
jgi:methylmalonyl-CoA decarboxylase